MMEAAMNRELFSILHDDEDIIVVNKAPFVLVTPDRFDKHKKSLLDIVSAHIRKKLFVVHRIDMETSGAVVFAKNANTHRILSMAFEGRAVHKTYLSVVHGRPSWTETKCELPLIPNGNKLHQTIVDKYHGKPCITNFKLLATVNKYAVIEVTPETGRTHQIRVHLAQLGHPIVCDPLYGSAALHAHNTERGVFLSEFKHGWRGDKFNERPLLERLGLHAWKLELPAPQGLQIEAPPAHDLGALLKQISKITSLSIK
jgi:RluA family pseudouridine synthase